MSNYATPLKISAGGGTPGGGVAIIRFNGVDYAPNSAGVVEFDYTYDQIQADWNAVTGPAAILNKPDLSGLDTAIQSGANIGSSGYNVFAGKTGTTLNFKLLQAGTNISMAQDGETITIHAVFPEYTQQPSDWNATTGPTRILNKPDLTPMTTALQGAESVGTGQNVFKAIVDKVLQFRGLRAGNNVTLTLDGDDLVIASAGGSTGPSGEANTSSSKGDGASVVMPKDGVDLPFRSFLAGAGLQWVVATDTLQVKLATILEGIAALGTVGANQLIYSTGNGNFNTAPFTVYGRSLIAAADAPAARTTLGLGTAAVRNVGTGALDLVENQALGTMARANTVDYLALGQFGYGRPIVSEETNLNNYQTEGLYIGPSGGITNGPSQLPALSRPIIRVIQRFGYISQEILDTQGLRTFCWRAATIATLANTPWNVGRDIPDIQTGPFANMGDQTRLAKVGSGGFGGPPLLMGDPTLANYIGAQELYGNTHVKRVEATAAGMFAYSPILHMGAIDTWWELQVSHSTGEAIIAYGYTTTRYGVLNLITSAMKAGSGHATAGSNDTLYMTPATTRAALNSPLVYVNATKTLVASDVQSYLRVNTAAISLEVPTNAVVAHPVGAEINIRNAASGNISIVAASGVTVHAPAGGSLVLGPRMTACLKKVDTNTWDLIGQTVAA